MTAVEVLRIERNVTDLDRAVCFHVEALGFTPIRRDERIAALRLGGQELRLTVPERLGRPYPLDGGSLAPWFQHCALVTPDMNEAYTRLIAYGCTAISREGPQTLPPATGRVVAFKFRDPDGHPLELIHSPGRANAPGIDHTAIGVADADRSIAFYRDRLGLRLATRQVNRGPEQDRLDDLTDAVVDVVALDPARATPHIELLGYHGRMPAAPAWDANDIAADRIVLAVRDPALLLARLDTSSLLIRDPDGHFIRLMDTMADRSDG